MNYFVYCAPVALSLASIIAAAVLLFPTVPGSENPEWTVFNESNTRLTDDDVRALVTDAQRNKWIEAERDGWARFDGVNWTVYDTDNTEV